MIISIFWNPSSFLFESGSFRLSWYGLFFAGSIVIAYLIAKRIFINEGLKREYVDYAFLITLCGGLIGARLGEVFFYNWDYFKVHPLQILNIWSGGLASHGGIIGLLLVIPIYSKFIVKKPVLWVLDKASVSIPVIFAFIRLGNLMNQEIYGKATSLPWGFIFPSIDYSPRHPAQLYEAILYALIFSLIMYLYWKTEIKNKPGIISGIAFSSFALARFCIEFFKENQVAFEGNLPLNMGQILSIPLFLFGLILIFYRLRKQPAKNEKFN